MAVTIRAAIDSVALQLAADQGLDVPAYGRELTALVARATRGNEPMTGQPASVARA